MACCCEEFLAIFNFFVYEIALNLLFFRKYFWKHLVEVKDHEVFFFM